MPKVKSIYVMLAGGLGNQLFQLAGALSRGGDSCILDASLVNPRTNKQGKVDISDFELGPDVSYLKPRVELELTSRAANFILRSGMNPKRIESWRLHRQVSIFLTAFLLMTRTRKSIKVLQGLDNGFFEMSESSQNEYLIGYFQSYKWFEQEIVRDQIRGIRLKVESLELDKFLVEEKNRRTVLMHVRLGDYKLEKDFGIPQSEYYEKSLNQIQKIRGIDRIWLFSDEPEEALAYVPTAYRAKVRIVPTFKEVSAVTLEAMRHADSYIIANSSLSWWGANLSYSTDPLIIAPSPWFKSKPEPRDIIPESWIRINAWG